MLLTKLRRGFFFAASALCFMSCVEALNEGNLGNNESGVLMTKVINTPSASVDGALLLRLTDDAVTAVASGDEAFRKELFEKVQIKSMEPIFNIQPQNEELARRCNLHRWFKVEFDDSDNSVVAAKLAEFSEVELIQYNKVVTPTSDLRFSVEESSLTQMYNPVPVAGPFFNDEFLDKQWHYINTGNTSIAATAVEGADLGVKDAWRLTAGDPRIIVAVIDGAVQYNHEDLAANMWVNELEKNGKQGVDDDGNGYVDDIYGWNCCKDSGDINWNHPKESGHGTHVAGIVAAVNNNGIGVCGTAGGTGKGDGVRLMSCQIFEGGESTLDASAIAFVYAADNGACIAQCSFGYEGEGAAYQSDAEYSTVFGAEYDAIEYFRSKNNSDVLTGGNIVIAAAGNDSRNQSSYPAAIRDVISVTSIGPDNLPAVCYTNYGPGCNIAAPGGDFYVGDYSTVENNKSRVYSTFIETVTDANLKKSGYKYAYMQGTSQACPGVSGVAALGLAYAYKLGLTIPRDEFVAMLLTSVNNLDSRLVDNVRKISGVKADDMVDLGLYKGKMGTGSIDAWKFLMAIEGTPTLTVKVLGAEDEAERYDLTSYFGGTASKLTYLSIECDEATKSSLGLLEDPEIKYGKLNIKPTKVGSGKVTIKAIAGGSNIGGLDQIGGMEICRTISIMSRGVAAANGGWL